jgi:hypothetical protein
VINALGLGAASRLIALMHRIQAQIARLALRIGLVPFANRDRRGACLDVVQSPLAVTLALAQVVQMSDRDCSQLRILLLAVDLNLAFQDGAASPRIIVEYAPGVQRQIEVVAP